MATERIHLADGGFFDVETYREGRCMHSRLVPDEAVADRPPLARCADCGDTFTVEQARAWFEFIKTGQNRL